MHWIYLIHEFHNLSWITEINELFHDILIYWDAPVYFKDSLEKHSDEADPRPVFGPFDGGCWLSYWAARQPNFLHPRSGHRSSEDRILAGAE